MLTPQVRAGVKAIYTDDTNLVKEGDLVVELDSSDYALAVERKKEELARAVRQVAALFQDVEAKKAALRLREAELKQAQLDFQHREPLVATGAVSIEEFETYQTAVQVSLSATDLAKRELEAATVLVEGTTIQTHPDVQYAVWVLRQAFLDLIRCHIWAPATGYIAKRSAQVGDFVEPGQTLLYIVPLNYIWAEANFKETKLRNVRIHQPVKFTADIYGREVEFHGKVVGFQPGSGNAFALLPPENASGNWIKIIQRVPLRISLEPEEIEKYPLLLGLSLRVHVDITDTSGERLSQIPSILPHYSTDLYTQQLEELQQMEGEIEEIITQNSQPTPGEGS